VDFIATIIAILVFSETFEALLIDCLMSFFQLSI